MNTKRKSWAKLNKVKIISEHLKLKEKKKDKILQW